MEAAISATGYERRLTFRLLSYWNRIRGDQDFPRFADVQADALGEVWHYCFIIGMATGDAPNFQHFGKELRALFHQDYAGQALGQALQHSPLGQTIGFYEKVCQRRAPVSQASSFVLEGCEARYRSLIVPLSTDQQEIDYLIGTANYRVFD